MTEVQEEVTQNGTEPEILGLQFSGEDLDHIHWMLLECPHKTSERKIRGGLLQQKIEQFVSQ